MYPQCARALALSLVPLAAVTLAAPADAAAPARHRAAQQPLCTVQSADLTVTVNGPGGTATAVATWDVSCASPVLVTAELQVSAPQRLQNPVKGSFGTAFRGRLSAAGTVDPNQPLETAVLTIHENGAGVIHTVTACAKEPTGAVSCHQSRARG